MIGPYYAFEQKVAPCAYTWDVLLQHTGLPGIEFSDYPQLRGFGQPEWSHLSEPAARQFTAALVPLVQSAFSKPLPETSPQPVP